MQRSVVLTGAGGFLAGHCAAAFRSRDWRVVGVGRSEPPAAQAGTFDEFHRDALQSPEPLAAVLARSRADALVHLAAPASVPQSWRDRRADFEAHVIPTVNMLEAVRAAAPSARVIVVSSAAVYGEPAALPIREDAPLAPISPYGFHKMHQELLLREYVRLHGIRGCIARVFSTYGENLRRLAVWEMTRRALAGHHDVLGSGDEARDYLYAGDVAAALAAVAEKAECDGQAINIASGQEVRIRDLASEIYALAGIDDAPHFTGEAMTGSPARWRADVSRLRALGFEAPDWSRGLRQTIRWIIDQTTDSTIA